MKDKSVTTLATEIFEPIAKDLGYVLVDVEYKKDFTGMILAVTLDKENGITLDDCEAFSRAVDEPLDIADITNGKSYNLTVSSYGLDRSLKTDYDFNKFLNKEIVVRFYAPFENKKEITAILVNFNKDEIIVNYNNEEVNLNFSKISNIKPFIKF